MERMDSFTLIARADHADVLILNEILDEDLGLAVTHRPPPETIIIDDSDSEDEEIEEIIPNFEFPDYPENQMAEPNFDYDSDVTTNSSDDETEPDSPCLTAATRRSARISMRRN
jgi:hypothetical protein